MMDLSKVPFEPYYRDEHCVIYNADCRQVLPFLPAVDAVITDPVWPNVPPGYLEGSADPYGLFAEIVGALPEHNRIVVMLRNDSDPRFLAPIKSKFLQCMWLRYSAVGHNGRHLTGNEVAYAFGTWPKSQKGRRVLPAIGPCEVNPVPRKNHPCPRSERHMRWIVGNWSDGIVLDPCAGSLTTACAAKGIGLQSICIEISEAYCEKGVKRLEQGVLF